MDIYPTNEDADGVTEWHVTVGERDSIVELDEGGMIAVTDAHGQCLELAHVDAFPELHALLKDLLVSGTHLVCGDGRPMYGVAEDRITLDMNDLGV
jgi:hypothetical protein